MENIDLYGNFIYCSCEDIGDDIVKERFQRLGFLPNEGKYICSKCGNSIDCCELENYIISRVLSRITFSSEELNILIPFIVRRIKETGEYTTDKLKDALYYAMNINTKFYTFPDKKKIGILNSIFDYVIILDKNVEKYKLSPIFEDKLNKSITAE